MVASPQTFNARDSGEIQMLRDQFTGNWQGVRVVKLLLAEREAELREKIKQQEQEQKK